MAGVAARRAIAILLGTVSVFASAGLMDKGPAFARTAGTPPFAEVRALWVVRTTLTSPESVARMVANAKASGFNTLIVQVRGRGDAYYTGSVEPRPPSLAAMPGFDPLATTITHAHDAGLKVHAWININLVGGLDLPASADHLVYRHPDWLMVPAALAQDLARVDVTSREYVSRLARYARTRPSDVEGVYLSPVTDASAEYTTAIVRAITKLYAVDGVHLDYIRYPGEDFDFGRQTLAAFRQTIAPTLTADERRRFDARLASDPLIYTRTFPDAWHSFRTNRLTALVSQIRTAVKTIRPEAVISAAVAPDPAVAAAHRLQDWRSWLARNLIDVVCPMAYTQDAATFASQMIAARQAAGAHPIWAGIGAYRLTPVQIGDNVQTARRLGADGVILFSYDSLTEPSRGPGYLAEVARAAFTNQ
jgi:uncharacterized lipoprotein YddW (UPF0748 family)